MEFLKDGGNLIAIFIPGKVHPDKTTFITPLEEPLQCGIGVFTPDKKVEPHRHTGTPALVEEFQEFIMVRKGKAIARVYGMANQFLKEYEMREGDALLLLRGGHSFSFEETTELLEIKQGPYKGREKMKVLI